MGDFNCEWTDPHSPLRKIAEALSLQAYQPEAEGMTTFPTLKKRLDWILISPELEFVSCKVLPDVVSDHLAVVAGLKVKEDKQ